MRRATSTLRLVRRQLAADASAALTVVLLVLVTTALAVATPRAMEQLYTEAARETVRETPPALRNVVSVTEVSLPLTGNPFSTVSGQEFLTAPGQEEPDEQGEDADPIRVVTEAANELEQSLSPALARVAGDVVTAVVTEEGRVYGADGEPLSAPVTVTTLRLQSGWQERVEFVEGSAPVGFELRDAEPVPEGETDIFFPEDPPPVTVVDVAMSVQTAQVWGMAVGEVHPLPVSVRGNYIQDIFLRITGVFEPIDVADPYWYSNLRILEPALTIPPLGGDDIRTGTVLLSPAGWGQLQEEPLLFQPATVELQVPIDETSIRAEDVAAIVAGIREVESVDIAIGEPGEIEGLILPRLRPVSELAEALEVHLQQRASATAVVSLVVAGLLTVALAVLALAGRLVAERRRSSMAIARARGASPRQLGLLLGGEGLLLGAPAAVAGWLLARWLVQGDGGGLAVGLAVLLGLAPAVLLPVLSRSGDVRGQRRDLGLAGSRRVRIVGELVVLALAVGGLVLLRRRGLATSVAEVGVDPLLAATPVLIGLAAAVIALRVYPLPLAAMIALASRRRGAVGFLGAARAAREGAAGTAPLLVLMLGLATAVFGIVVSSTVTTGTAIAVAENVGADAAAAGLAYTEENLAAAAAVPGVATLAGVHTDPNAELAPAGDDGASDEGERVLLVATDPTALGEVQAGLPGAPTLPAELSAPVEPGQALPGLAQRGVAAVGDALEVNFNGRTALVTVVATAPGGIPGVSAGREWILLPLQPLRDAVALNLLPQDVLFAAEPGATLDTDRLAEALLATPANLRTPASVSTRLTDNALIDGVRTAFPVGAAVGAGYSALAMVLTLVVTARPRHRILSHLHTLGLTARQSRGLVALELAPLALTALAAGLAVGLATLWLVEPAVDLQPFTGGRGTPDIVIDPAGVGLVAGSFLAVVALAVLSAVTASRRLRAGTVLRLGEEA